MKPTVEDFLRRGYFPKELPPAFNSFKFGTEYAKIKIDWTKVKDCPEQILTQDKYFESPYEFNIRKRAFNGEFKKRCQSSTPCKYSITKGRLSRRYISIPNPLHYMKLAEAVVDAWSEIENIINASPLSQSTPEYQDGLDKRAFTTSCRGVSAFRKKCLNTSFNKKVELILDISKFYPSIYTHSVPWAILGKEKAKEILHFSEAKRKLEIEAGNLECITYNKADCIDICIRNGQGNQTVGIPIGTDISFILAELICARIDDCIKKVNNNIEGCRFYDDYYLYVNTSSEAEGVLKEMQRLLDDFGLSINEEKIQIRTFPFELEDQFAVTLSKYDLKNCTENDLRIYFGLMWKFAEKDSRKIGQIFRYGLRPFDPLSLTKVKIGNKEWELFEDLLFKTMILDPSILNIAYRILLSYSPLSNNSKARLTQIVCCIFEDHIQLNQDLEVSWALWLCKIFDLDVAEDYCTAVLKRQNAISTLILLDIINSRPILQNNPSLSSKIKEWSDSFTENSFFDENWLLLYEGILKGWIDRKDLLKKNPFFKILFDNKITFYDDNPKADYTSKSFILSILKDPIEDQKLVARRISNEICEAIFDRKAHEILDGDEIEDYLSNNLADLILELKDWFDSENLEAEIYDDVLLHLREHDSIDIDQEYFIKIYMARLDEDSLY